MRLIAYRGEEKMLLSRWLRLQNPPYFPMWSLLILLFLYPDVKSLICPPDTGPVFLLAEQHSDRNNHCFDYCGKTNCSGKRWRTLLWTGTKRTCSKTVWQREVLGFNQICSIGTHDKLYVATNILISKSSCFVLRQWILGEKIRSTMGPVASNSKCLQFNITLFPVVFINPTGCVALNRDDLPPSDSRTVAVHKHCVQSKFIYLTLKYPVFRCKGNPDCISWV